MTSPAAIPRPSFCQTWTNRSGGEIILQSNLVRSHFIDLPVIAYFDDEEGKVTLNGRRVPEERLPEELKHFFDVARELGSTRTAINGNKIAVRIDEAVWEEARGLLQAEADSLYEAGVYLAS